MNTNTSSDDPYVRLSIELRESNLIWLDGLVQEWGLRNRTEAINRLLEELAKPSSEA